MSAARSTGKTAGPAEVLYIPVEGDAAYHGAVVYYAVLAYPRRDEWPKRVEFVRAVRALCGKVSIAGGDDRKSVPAAYRSLKNEKLSGILSKGFHRITVRLHACVIACGIIYSDYVPGPGDPPALGFSTVNQAARAIMEGQEELPQPRFNEPEAGRVNIEHRVWASSLPGLHLAMSLFHTVGLVVTRTSLPTAEVLRALLFSERWVKTALFCAEQQWKPFLAAKIPTFDPEEAIRLLPTEDLRNAYLLLLEDFQRP